MIPNSQYSFHLPKSVRYPGREKPALQNQVPYIARPHNTKEDEIPDDDFIHHANMRIYDFAITACALHNLALRSDSSPRKTALKIANAYLQFGKGTTELPACHHNVGAGYADNVQELMIREMACEKKSSPQKAQVLRAKGFRDEDFKYLESMHYSAKSIQTVMNRVWPFKQGYAHSMLKNTATDMTLSGTEMLPRDLNLKCDKYLETRLRHQTETLYHQLMHSELTIEESVQRFVSEVKDFFQKSIEGLNSSKQRLENLKASLEQLEKAPQDSKIFEQVKENIKALKMWHKERRRVKKQASKEKLPEPEISYTPKVSMNTNYKLGSVSVPPSEEMIRECLMEMTREIQKLERLIRYERLEEEGSSMPDLDRLFAIPSHIKEKSKKKMLRTTQLELLSPYKRKEEGHPLPQAKKQFKGPQKNLFDQE